MKGVEVQKSFDPNKRAMNCWLTWEKNYPNYLPAEVDDSWLMLRARFPYKVIWKNRYKRAAHIVRTDAQPLIWVWWWWVLRINETFRLMILTLLYVGETWGLLKIPPYELPSIKYLFNYLRDTAKSKTRVSEDDRQC
jgi:hypothetical protein